MRRYIFFMLLCLVVTVSQASFHKPLSKKEVMKVTRLDCTTYQHVKVYVCSNLESVKEGDVVKVGIYFSIDEGWNIYDNNPEAYGYLPTKIEWSVPEGCKIVREEWQQPVKLFEDMDKMGYFHGCFVVVCIRVECLSATVLEITGNCEWQMCDDRQCIQKRGKVSVRLKNKGTKKTEFYDLLKKW